MFKYNQLNDKCRQYCCARYIFKLKGPYIHSLGISLTVQISALASARVSSGVFIISNEDSKLPYNLAIWVVASSTVLGIYYIQQKKKKKREKEKRTVLHINTSLKHITTSPTQEEVSLAFFFSC